MSTIQTDNQGLTTLGNDIDFWIFSIVATGKNESCIGQKTTTLQETGWLSIIVTGGDVSHLGDT